MVNLLKQNHASFIVGRNILNNIIIAQKAFHSMKTIKGRKGWMALKVDLEKAYNRIIWDFLEDTLLDVGIPSLLVNVLKHIFFADDLILFCKADRDQVYHSFIFELMLFKFSFFSSVKFLFLFFLIFMFVAFHLSLLS